MKSNKVVLIVLIIIAMGFTLVSCGSEEKKEVTIKKPLRLIATKEDSQGMEGLSSDINIKTLGNNSEVFEKILSSGWDVAIVDPLTAVKAYNNSGSRIKVVSPISFANLDMLQNGYSPKIKTIREYNDKTKKYEEKQIKEETLLSPFARKKIFVLGDEGGLTDTVMKILFRKVQVNPQKDNIKYVDNIDNMKNEMDTFERVGFLNDKDAKKIMEARGNIKKVFDISEKWEANWKDKIPSLVLIVNKNFLEERGKEMPLVLKEFGEAISKHNESSGINRVFYSESNRGINILKRFYSILEEFNKESLEGKIPNDDFYYSI